MGMSSGTGTTDFLPFGESIYHNILAELFFEGRKKDPVTIHRFLSENNNAEFYIDINRKGLERVLLENENNFFVQALRKGSLPETTERFFENPREHFEDFEKFYSLELPRLRNLLFKLYPKPGTVEEEILSGAFSKERKVNEDLIYVRKTVNILRLSADFLVGGIISTIVHYNTGSFDSTMISFMLSAGISDYILEQSLKPVDDILVRDSGAYFNSVLEGYLRIPIKRAKESYLSPAKKIQYLYNKTA